MGSLSFPGTTCTYISVCMYFKHFEFRQPTLVFKCKCVCIKIHPLPQIIAFVWFSDASTIPGVIHYAEFRPLGDVGETKIRLAVESAVWSPQRYVSASVSFLPSLLSSYVSELWSRAQKKDPNLPSNDPNLNPRPWMSYFCYSRDPAPEKNVQ